MTDIIYRSFAQSEPKISKEKREATFSFASDLVAVPRYFGLEVLGMENANIDRERVDSNNLPLLLNHSVERPIGAVRDIWQESRKSYAKVKFSHVRDAEDLLEDWSNNIRTGVSVGYRVLRMQRVAKGDQEKDEPDTFKAILWKPLEVSAGVPVPADHTVGPFRSETGEDRRYDGTEFVDEHGAPLQIRQESEGSIRSAANTKDPTEQMLEQIRERAIFEVGYLKPSGLSIAQLRCIDQFLKLPIEVRDRIIKG
jgi:hypothetical protein